MSGADRDLPNLSRIADDFKEEQPNRVDGRISIDLKSEEMEEVREIARQRNKSYNAGRTADTNYTKEKGLKSHIRGVTAEFAMQLLYDESEVDRSISEKGDDGVDCQLQIDGESYDIDIKASSYQNAWILIKRGFDHEEADAYVSAYVDGKHVEFVGFAWAEDVLREENLEESPSPYSDHLNYEMKGGFEPIPEPDLSDERVSF
jgi:hypothetical protein